MKNKINYTKGIKITVFVLIFCIFALIKSTEVLADDENINTANEKETSTVKLEIDLDKQEKVNEIEVESKKSVVFKETNTKTQKTFNGTPRLAAIVTVYFKDEAGVEIAEKVVAYFDKGMDYFIEPKDVPGYTVIDSEGEVGGYIEAYYNREGTWIYSKNKEYGNVVTEYVDEEGIEIADSNETTDEVGKDYTTDKKEIEGYTFKEVIGNPTGQYTAGTITVKYVYTKNPEPVIEGKVVTEYVDELGEEIANSNETTDEVGKDYTTEKKEIEGYTFKEVVGNEVGQYTKEDIVVTYVYVKDIDPTEEITKPNIEKDKTTDKNKSENKKNLPKMGYTTSIIPTILGMTMSLGSLYEFFIKKK